MDQDASRCSWAGSDPLYQSYHDREWGRPVAEDRRLFEKIALEGFQSGLSWLTVLRKRERFREVFHGFDPARVAAMGEPEIDRLLADPGIIRHRGKIVSTINNAARVLAIQAEFGSFAAYVWRFEPGTEESAKAMSKDLKKRGFTFVGPTTCYAFMQAMGLVNDHAADCFCRPQADADRRDFEPPVTRLS